jgi:hypothetical protein
MNDYQKRLLKELMGAKFVIRPDFDFTRDVLDALDRARLGETIRVFSYEAEWQRLVAKRLAESTPTPEEWLMLAQSSDPKLKHAAKEHLLANDPSGDALWLIILAGSSTKAQKKRAAEIAIARGTDKKALRAVLHILEKGPLVRQSWKRLKEMDLSEDDLTMYILRYAKDVAVLNEAWEILVARTPSESGVSFTLVFCGNQEIRNRAGAFLLGTEIQNPDNLSYIVTYCDHAPTREAAAERLLRRKPKSEHLADIAQHVSDPALAETGWKLFKKQKFSARNQERLSNLRGILCFAKQAGIRAEAFEIGKTAPFDGDDREFIVKYALDAEVRAYFAAATAGS